MRTRQISTRKKAMLKALEKSLGIVTDAANEVGIDRTTHYLWMQEDEDYKARVEAISEMVLDIAESQLYQQIKENNTVATIFFLKTKGKKRGYIEKTEMGFTDKEGNDIIFREERTYEQKVNGSHQIEQRDEKQTG